MSQKVLFNGAVLVRPGAYTKIDASGFINVTLSGVGVVGLVGEADGGAPNVIQTFRNAAAAKAYYKSGPLVEAAQIAFQPGNDPRIGGGATLLVTVKVNQGTQSTLSLAGAAGIANVANVAVGNQGTAGGVTYTYAVIALLNGGVTAAAGAAVASTATGNAILNSVNFNRITWDNIATAQGYLIYRTVSNGNPSTTGLIGSVAAGITTFDDTGKFGDNTKAPTINTTGLGLLLTSRDYGKHTNNISAQVTAGATAQGRIISIRNSENGLVTTQVSPSLGDTAKFTLVYTGAGTPATATITQGPNGKLTTAITGGPGGENLDLTLKSFKNLSDLINAINASAGGVYTATAVTLNPGFFDPTNLDPATAINIKTPAVGSFYSAKYDILSWINANAALVFATSGGSAGPPNTMGSFSFFSGGFRGVTSNTNFTNAIALLGTIRVNQVAALAATDGTFSENQGSIVNDSYTAVSVAAAVDAHCTFYSSTSGKSERQAWIGMLLTKAGAISQANTLNSFSSCLVCQKITLPTVGDNFVAGAPAGSFVAMPEWALAVACAGMRAGAQLGEPLTWKYVRAFGLTQTADWTVQNDAEDLVLNGVIILENVPGKGFRVMKGVTTYTRTDNNALTQESVVQGWKNIAFEWRTALEDRYTGTRGLVSNVQTVVPFSKVILGKLRDQGAIADSVVDGVVTPGFHDITADLVGDVLSVEGTVSPVEGINFVLQTIFIVPAQISL